jgi:very-short-patch-repair endonuclease
MWRLLREYFLEARFRRQAPIRHYIADFASHRAKLVIEVDGGQHGSEGDADRDRVIISEGYRILRFWNHDVLGNPDGVASVIADALPRPHPHQASPIEGEEVQALRP